ncbi:uncharacterized protein TRAVEDRAFT_49416 [Trametes versicolor FP-101664 SS1]|uniref:uncharacterized protein n=1 Tax=Trametes versicolor (strain FP-101664) TaxID=717944 RepID=UPI000462492E|nr:uncharacterized protein TRAVEDRAFT_49416 [Trametes versicolor FP-101664 SS1]EIW56598.1 hypothetical protein TRAVEDRAFT_49416 [Trametes versicolor FP-101664 SS1]
MEPQARLLEDSNGSADMIVELSSEKGVQHGDGSSSAAKLTQGKKRTLSEAVHGREFCKADEKDSCPSIIDDDGNSDGLDVDDFHPPPLATSPSLLVVPNGTYSPEARAHVRRAASGFPKHR